jgi:hypothetical protein
MRQSFPALPLLLAWSWCRPGSWRRAIMMIIPSRISSPVSVETRWRMIIGAITISTSPAGKNGRRKQPKQQNRHHFKCTFHDGSPPRFMSACNCRTPNTAPDGSASMATSSFRSGSSPTSTLPPSFSAFRTMASISLTLI